VGMRNHEGRSDQEHSQARQKNQAMLHDGPP
jgi:hypothetical protein